jgi:predicted nucleic acid-binding protein
MVAVSLIDTNVLVYRFDARFPEKQAIATRLLREGLSTDSVRIPHQAVLEFMAVVTRVRIGAEPLLGQAQGARLRSYLTSSESCIPMRRW